jgi:polysaccharide export outer membrane protein
MMRKVGLTIGAYAASLLLAACSGTGGGSQAGLAQRTGSLPPPQVMASVPNASEAEYRIGPLDLLDISVFQVPDLSKEVQVNESGQISLPLIGAVQAGGKTVAQLQTDIAAALSKSYMQSPQVSVVVKEANSQRITVDGAVTKPGQITLSGTTTLLQAVALSGGLAKGADARGILVFRTVDQKKTVAKFDLNAIRKGTAQDPVMYGGDVVVVDTTLLGSALGGLRDTVPVFGIFTALSTL